MKTSKFMFVLGGLMAMFQPAMAGSGVRPVVQYAVKSETRPVEPAPSARKETRPPTYLHDVMPIVMGKCYRCHNQQTTFLNNWLDYRTAYADRAELKRRIWDSWKGLYFKQPMPMANSPESEAMTKEERGLIKQWIETGAAYGVPPTERNGASKAERIEAGRQVFTTICAACHQPTGMGLPERFPPLAGSDFLNADKRRAIKVLLNGLSGEVTVNGLKFNNSMPQFPFSDGQIAAALTYVYNSFGNSGQEVTTEEVKEVRAHNDGVVIAGNNGTRTRAGQEISPWE